MPLVFTREGTETTPERTAERKKKKRNSTFDDRFRGTLVDGEEEEQEEENAFPTIDANKVVKRAGDH